MPSHYGKGKKKKRKKAPAGYHYMPNGKLMKNGKHKSKRKKR
jgi:hypothetical protein|tara:strand:- start:24 stop:149 length:126 start_codon:yes stop_codon:yes gene_type:complete